MHTDMHRYVGDNAFCGFKFAKWHKKIFALFSENWLKIERLGKNFRFYALLANFCEKRDVGIVAYVVYLFMCEEVSTCQRKSYFENILANMLRTST